MELCLQRADYLGGEAWSESLTQEVFGSIVRV
jgi:hypothetical protein